MKIPSVAQNEKKRFYAILDMNTFPDDEDEYSHLPCIHQKEEVRLIFSLKEAKETIQKLNQYYKAKNELFFLKKVSEPSKNPDALYVVVDLDLSWHKSLDIYSDKEEIAAFLTPTLIPEKSDYKRYIMNYNDAIMVKNKTFSNEHLRIYLLQPHKPKN